MDKSILNYIKEHSSENSIFDKIERETHLKTINPNMSSDFVLASLLKVFVQMLKPKVILEIGTFTGYSTIAMAQSLDKDSKIITIERNLELKNVLEKNLNEYIQSKQVEIVFDNALNVIPNLNVNPDIVFIDGDKREYIDYYNLIFPKIQSGAYILVDNVLWHNNIFNDNIKSNDYQTKTIIKFNEMIKIDIRIEKLLLPIRDGLYIIRKL